MTRIDTYKHLDKDYPIRMEMSVPDLAKCVVAQNYGAHRFLSALVHALREDADPRYPSELAAAIEDALNRGFTH